MTQREMEQEIAKRTGLPMPAVKLLMETLKDVMSESLFRQQDVVFQGLFRIKCTGRQHSSITTPPGADHPKRKTVVRLMLGIRPVQAFRQEMNRWTSSLSSSMTNS